MARKINRLINIDRVIGRRIKARRVSLGMTMPDLAKKIEVTHQQVQKYENGTNRISAGRLYAIGQALNVQVSFFFDDVEGEGAQQEEALPNEGQRMCIEVAKNFMSIQNKDYQSMINSMIKTLSIGINKA